METLQDPSEPSLVDGAMSGHYQIRRRLGEGGFGQVFEAWDPKLCRSIALKRLKPSGGALQPDTLLKEGRLAASLKHSAFVKIFSVEGDGDAQSIIMELVEGSTLRQAALQNGMHSEQALDIVRQVAEAMAEAHANHLIHGDIKPSNLMLEASGQIRILDFGLARQIDPLATQTMIFEDSQGTVAYMAPERLLGAAPDASSDLYALGVVLYELIAGQLPFHHLSGLALAAAHIQTSSEQWSFPDTAEPAVVALVRAMTARDVALRPASMQALCDALRALQEGPQVAQRRAPAALRVRWQRLAPDWRRLLLSGVAALVLAAGLGQLYATGAFQQLAAAPYSEATALRVGNEALRLADRDGSLDTAIKSFSGILERNPHHAAAAAGLSLAYSFQYASDSRDETWLQRADASAQQAIRENDQLAAAYVAQSLVRELQGQLEPALQLADRALGLDPHNLFALIGKAEILLRLDRMADVESLIQGALVIHPSERLFTDILGTFNYKKGNYPAAEQAFRRSIELDPDSAASYANLNMALLSQNRDDDALQVLQQGLQVRPNSQLYRNLGTALFARGDYSGAAQAFEHAVSSGKGSPNDYLNWANLADTLRWIPGRSDESRQAYMQASKLLEPLLRRYPNDSLRQSRMGLYLAKLGDVPAALKWSASALATAANDANVHFRAAVAYEVIGRREAALAELAQAASLGYPGNMIATEPDLLALRRDIRYHHINKEASR